MENSMVVFWKIRNSCHMTPGISLLATESRVLKNILGGSVVKNAGDTGHSGSIPGLGRSLGEGNSNPLQYSWLGNPMTEEPGGLQSMGSQRVRGLSTYTYALKNICTHIVIEAFFTRGGGNPNVQQQMNGQAKCAYSMMEYDSALKRKKILTDGMMWMDLTDIMLSEQARHKGWIIDGSTCPWNCQLHRDRKWNEGYKGPEDGRMLFNGYRASVWNDTKSSGDEWWFHNVEVLSTTESNVTSSSLLESRSPHVVLLG